MTKRSAGILVSFSLVVILLVLVIFWSGIQIGYRDGFEQRLQTNAANTATANSQAATATAQSAIATYISQPQYRQPIIFGSPTPPPARP